MKKLLLSLLCTLVAAIGHLQAQTVDEILEDGRIIGRNENIYLRMDAKGNWEYFAGQVLPVPASFTLLGKNELIMLRSRTSATVFLPAVNPLNNLFEDSTYRTIDAVDTAASGALRTIAGMFSSAAGGQNAFTRSNPALTEEAADCILAVRGTYEEALKKIVEVNTRESAATSFKRMASLRTLGPEAETRLSQVAADTVAINSDLKNLSDAIVAFDNATTEYSSCEGNEGAFQIYTFKRISEDLHKLYDQDVARKNNLVKAVNVFANAIERAKPNGYFYDKRNDLSKDSVTHLSIKYYQSGYTLNDKNEIVEREKKELNQLHLRFRRFQSIVPEVLAGVAYTFLEFPKYGVRTDTASNKQFVESAGEDEVRKFNVNVMLNFNVYTGTTVCPFLQLGAGINVEHPAFFGGGGFRFKVGKTVLALSGGVAGAFIRDLDKLKVGDEVSGTAQLEEDLKREFQLPLKGYFGVQVKL